MINIEHSKLRGRNVLVLHIWIKILGNVRIVTIYNLIVIITDKKKFITKNARFLSIIKIQVFFIISKIK